MKNRIREFRKWMAESSERKGMTQLWFLHYRIKRSSEFAEQYDADESWKELEAKIRIKKRDLYLRYVSSAVAACAMIAIGMTVFFSSPGRDEMHTAGVSSSSKVKVLLASGEEIGLTSDTESIELGGGLITKNEQGFIITSETDSDSGRPDSKNTRSISKIITEIGGEIHFVLSDGTRVWLNACSELSFPVEFTDTERKVELKGEACFEVSRNEQRPFFVTAGAMSVKVLGTVFNINAYDDEPTVCATLLSGKVRVEAHNQEVELNPNVMAVFDTNSKTLRKQPAETEVATAWMGGYFIFHDETIETVVRTLARWYDMDFIFSKDISKQHTFNGRIRKDDLLSEILDRITLAGGPKFLIENHIVHVQ